MPCLVIYSVHKRHCFLSVSALTSKKISATLFVVCLSINTFFLPFSGSLTCKYITRIYPVAGYSVNTRSTPYCLLLIAENVSLIFFRILKPYKAEFFFQNVRTFVWIGKIQENFEKMFFVFQIMGLYRVAEFSLNYDENTCDQQSMCYEILLRF